MQSGFEKKKHNNIYCATTEKKPNREGVWRNGISRGNKERACVEILRV